jgi:hypothetical protein
MMGCKFPWNGAPWDHAGNSSVNPQTFEDSPAKALKAGFNTAPESKACRELAEKPSAVECFGLVER